jgi:hypothetical protein
VFKKREKVNMSDDLVKRLRRADTCIFPTERERCHCGEAADRILKLEAALREIAWIATPDHEEARHKATEIARKALDAE